jgi:23S rRNA (uracil1939-C5)-methyltransferase
MRERSEVRARLFPAEPVAPVRVLRIAAGGDGVARLADGRTVFIPRTAPGDLVEIELVHVARRFVRGRVLRVLEPGPNRIAPPCPHYTRDDCGGCQLQHLNAASQLSAKQSIVGETLRRVGKLELPDPSIIPSMRAWEYRTRITLARGKGGRLGLHPHDRPAEVFDLDRCLITELPLMELWSAVRRQRDRLPSDLTHLVLRLDRDGRRHLIAQTSGDRAWTDAEAMATALDRAGQPVVIWWQPEGGAARVLAGDSMFPATVFEQVHPDMGDTVRAYAVERLGDVQDRGVWDLYAGIGETTLALLSRGARVESVESDPRAVAEAEKRITAAGTHAGRSRLVVGRAEEVVGGLQVPDLVIANPPRTGMDAAVVKAIAERRPARLVYISCDPATLARDLERLGPGFRVMNVQGFDLFPQTAHVETVVTLSSTGGEG